MKSASQISPPNTEADSATPQLENAPEETSSISTTLASKLRSTSFRTTETYVAYAVAAGLFDACSPQADYDITGDIGIYDRSNVRKTADGEDLGVSDAASSFWHETLGLPPTFSTWYQVAFLHMYIVTVRLRVLDRESFDIYMQHLVNAFSYGAEDKMIRLHGLQTSSVRNKYIKDLFLQWRGVLAAYDEGLVKGDAVLAGALWRNLWKGRVDVNWENVAKVVEYVRKAIDQYDKAPDEDILFAVTGDDTPNAVPLLGEEKAGDARPKGLFDRLQNEMKKGEKSPSRSQGIREPFGAEDSAFS